MTESAAAPPAPGGDERDSLGAPEQRWSFKGATAIATSAGVLLPEMLVVGAGHAMLYGIFDAIGEGPAGRGQAAPGASTRNAVRPVDPAQVSPQAR